MASELAGVCECCETPGEVVESAVRLRGKGGSGVANATSPYSIYAAAQILAVKDGVEPADFTGFFRKITVTEVWPVVEPDSEDEGVLIRTGDWTRVTTYTHTGDRVVGTTFDVGIDIDVDEDEPLDPGGDETIGLPDEIDFQVGPGLLDLDLSEVEVEDEVEMSEVIDFATSEAEDKEWAPAADAIIDAPAVALFGGGGSGIWTNEAFGFAEVFILEWAIQGIFTHNDTVESFLPSDGSITLKVPYDVSRRDLTGETPTEEIVKSVVGTVGWNGLLWDEAGWRQLPVDVMTFDIPEPVPYSVDVGAAFWTV